MQTNNRFGTFLSMSPKLNRGSSSRSREACNLLEHNIDHSPSTSFQSIHSLRNMCTHHHFTHCSVTEQLQLSSCLDQKKFYELAVERKVLTLRYPLRVTRNRIKNVSGNAKKQMSIKHEWMKCLSAVFAGNTFSEAKHGIYTFSFKFDYCVAFDTSCS